MAILVIGGHSRSVGKTSVAASLIRQLSAYNWTAFKITQFGHAFCSANGEPCDCQTGAHTFAMSAERDTGTNTDSARFLAAGAQKAFWVRTRTGFLAQAMPSIQKEVALAQNSIFESNSLLQFLRPDLYLAVLDHATADFKPSALRVLDRADALLVRASSQGLDPHWVGVSRRLFEGKPRFLFDPCEPLPGKLLDFIRPRLKHFS